MWLTNKLSTGVLDRCKVRPAHDKSLSASSLLDAGNLGEALEFTFNMEVYVSIKSISYTLFATTQWETLWMPSSMAGWSTSNNLYFLQA